MMGGGGSGGDAERWLATAEKLLLSGDLNGSKTYAIRACEADHSLVDHAELILAVADTLIAGESRIRGSTADLPDWYAVLRLVRLTHNPELVATQYSRLAVLLNPSRNRLPYSDQAFRLISDAWYVLSDPSRKALYDRELHLSQFGQLGQIGFQLFNQPPQSPQHQQQSPQHQQQSPQHQQQHLRASFQNQQIPFQLHQQPQQHPHFAQPQHQKSQFDQQVMQSQSLQEQQHASWRQQFGQDQSEPVRSGSSSSGRDWKLPVEEERLINLNNATERVQPSRHFNEPERSSSGRSYEASSHRSPSTDLTWPSKPTQTSEPVPWQSAESPRQFQPSRSMEAAQLSLLPSASDQPYVSQQTRSTQSHAVPKPTQTCVPVPWQSSEQPRQFQPSRFMEAAQLSLLPSVSDQTSVSQQTRSTQSHSVSKPQPVSKPFSVSQPSATAKPFPVSQPPPASKPFLVSQPPITSKPLPVSQPAKTTTPLPVSQPPITSKPFSVSQPSATAKPFPVSQPPPASKPFPVSQPPPVSKPLPVSQPPITSKTFPVSQPLPASKPFPVSQPPPASKPLPVSQSPPTSLPFPVSQSPITSKPFSVSQPSATAKPFTVSQPRPASKPFPVSQPPKNSKPLLVPQPPPTSKPLPVSQPPETSNPLPVSQPPHQAFQSTAPSHLPVASSRPAPLPPVFNSAQSLQPPPVSATPSPMPAISTNPSPPPPLSQPTWVPNQTPATEHSPESGVARSDSDPKVPSFWTTCPYCFVLYEYPSLYEESVLQCQTRSCRRAFQAVKVPSPPPIAEEDSYYCCWGFYPIGFTEMTKIPVKDLPKSAPRGFPMVAKIPGTYIPNPAPKKPAPKVYYYDEDDDDSYIDSDPSEDEDEDDGDDDWLLNGTKKRKNVKQSKQKASTKLKRGRTRKVIEVD